VQQAPSPDHEAHLESLLSNKKSGGQVRAGSARQSTDRCVPDRHAKRPLSSGNASTWSMWITVGVQREAFSHRKVCNLLAEKESPGDACLDHHGRVQAAGDPCRDIAPELSSLFCYLAVPEAEESGGGCCIRKEMGKLLGSPHRCVRTIVGGGDVAGRTSTDCSTPPRGTADLTHKQKKDHRSNTRQRQRGCVYISEGLGRKAT